MFICFFSIYIYYISVQYAYVLGEANQKKRKYTAQGDSIVKAQKIEEIKKNKRS